MSTKFEVVKQDSVEDIYVGDSTNEYHIGNEYSRRITWKHPEGGFLSLTSTVYLKGRVYDKHGEVIEEEATEDDKDLPFYHGVVDFDNFEDDQRFLEVWEWGEDEWLWHTDLEDLGGTETRSEIEALDQIGYLWPTNLQDGYDKIKAYLTTEDYFEYYAPENV